MTRHNDRIASLDVLRGLGVLGILPVNAAGFALPMAAYAAPTLLPLDHASQIAWAVTHVFFERKFVTLFSLLFGASVLLVGGEGRDSERNAVLKRRLGWLAVFGVLHGAAIWYGDILLLYAAAGALAAYCRSWRPSRLILVGVPLCLGVAALEATGQVLSLIGPLDYAPATPPASELTREIAAYRGGLASAALQNLKSWSGLATGSLVVFTWSTLGLMLIGMALLKTQVLQARAHAGLYVGFVLVGLAALTAIGWPTLAWLQTGMTSPTLGALTDVANIMLAPLVTLGYLGGVALMLKAGWLRGVRDALADVGRMAFTNYLAQSLLMTTIFWSGRGFGLFGQVSRAELWALVVAIWALQIAWSRLWMGAFRYGPLEWIWRRLSYGRPVAIRRAAA